MKNIVAGGTVVIVVVPALLLAGHRFVPNVTGTEGHFFSNEFLFNGYIAFLGFFLTSAAIGPIVAQFLEWRANKEWASARRNARNRLARSLNVFISTYRAFLEVLTNESDERHAPMFLDQAVAALAEFFDTYTTEHVTFNAGMHSAASNIRNLLLPLQRSLTVTKSNTHRNRSHRAYFHADALNKLRTLVDLTPISEASSLARDTYLSKYGKLFVDLQIDQQLGAGSITLHRFSALNIAAVLAEWSAFCDSCEMSTKSSGGIQEKFEFDDDTQARLHSKFVRSMVEEEYLAKASGGAYPDEPTASPVDVSLSASPSSCSARPKSLSTGAPLSSTRMF